MLETFHPENTIDHLYKIKYICAELQFVSLQHFHVHVKALTWIMFEKKKEMSKMTKCTLGKNQCGIWVSVKINNPYNY